MGLKKDIEANDTKMPIVRKTQDYYLTKGLTVQLLNILPMGVVQSLT